MKHGTIYPKKVLYPVKKPSRWRDISRAVSKIVSKMKPLPRCICGDVNCEKV